MRVDAAQANYARPIVCHVNNGDEERYNVTRIASFSKGLPHDALGHVLPAAYDALLRAVTSGRAADFEAIPMGGTRSLINPQAGLAFDLQGQDSHSLNMPPPPAFASAELAGEIVELYWMARLRDVRFDEYATHPLAAQASAGLAALSKYGGPTAPGLLFRHYALGTQIGPYLSQFLYKPIPFGAAMVDQQVEPPLAGRDYVTTWEEYLRIQNGEQPSQSEIFSSSRRYMINGRDLSHWVHIDVLFQAYFHAMLALINLNAPVKPSNPYFNSSTQDAFGTFGPPFIGVMTAEPATRALKSVWFQKWFVNRRFRPEVMAARVDRHKRGFAKYPIHPDVLNSTVVDAIFQTYGSYLLPQAFPEGSPTHPAYGAGHATVGM